MKEIENFIFVMPIWAVTNYVNFNKQTTRNGYDCYQQFDCSWYS